MNRNKLYLWIVFVVCAGLITWGIIGATSTIEQSAADQEKAGAQFNGRP